MGFDGSTACASIAALRLPERSAAPRQRAAAARLTAPPSLP